MGSILIEMKGIQGYARICPGDVFEISIKYGSEQKWKTKGKVLKDGINQLWEHQSVMFKALLEEEICIKAVEVKSLGKKVVLGNKLCDTRHLFSPHPQLMTINLNNIATLKLNLIITWNPLHGVPTNEYNLKSQLSSKSCNSLFGSIRSLSGLFSSTSLSTGNRLGTLTSHRASTLVLNTSGNSPSMITDPFDLSFPSSSGIVYPAVSGFQSYVERKKNRMKKSHSAIAGISIKSSNSDHSTSSSGSTSSSSNPFTGRGGGGGSSGFASGESCLGSVPGSTLTSPDTESAPIFTSNGAVIHRHPSLHHPLLHHHRQQEKLESHSPVNPTSFHQEHHHYSMHHQPQRFAMNRNQTIYAQPTTQGVHHHFRRENQQHQQFLSASVSNLTRTDSALLNKKPRPLSQVMEQNTKNYHQVVNHLQQQNHRQESQQNTLSSVSSLLPSSGRQTLTNSISARNSNNKNHLEQHQHYYCNSINNNYGFTEMRTSFMDNGFQDDSIIEAADENTDCSSDLSDGSPEKASLSRRSRRSSDDGAAFNEEEDVLQYFDSIVEAAEGANKITDVSLEKESSLSRRSRRLSDGDVPALIEEDDVLVVTSRRGAQKHLQDRQQQQMRQTQTLSSAAGSSLISPDTESAPIFTSTGAVIHRHMTSQRHPSHDYNYNDSRQMQLPHPPTTTVSLMNASSMHHQSQTLANNNNNRNNNGNVIYSQPTHFTPEKSGYSWVFTSDNKTGFTPEKSGFSQRSGSFLWLPRVSF